MIFFMTIPSLLLAYLIGSFPSAILVAKFFYKTDLFSKGSGNPGATNTWRVLGAKAGCGVLIADIFKGWLAVWIVLKFHGLHGDPLLAMIAAICGHTWSIWIGFRGGKGVATSLGACLTLAAVPVLGSVAAFLIVLRTTRWVSLASLTGAIAFPPLLFYFQGTTHLFWFSIVLVIMIFIRHHANIGRLYHGNESKIKFFWEKHK